MGFLGLVWRPWRVSSSARRVSSRNINTSAAVVLNIPKANVYRFGDANNLSTPVFRDLEWSIKTNESWAVVGSGSGEKSSVFDMLMGNLRINPPPPPPLGLFPFLAARDLDPHSSLALVSFANKRTAGGAFYDYTARYGAVREEDRITLRQSMFPEMIDDLKARSRVSLDPPATVEQKELFEYLVARMGLGTLLDLPRIALSNGQTRRARILKALLGKPRLLLLDEPLTGLDVENRAAVLRILQELHVACDPHIIIGLRMQDAVPDWITHLAVVGAGQVRTGSKDAMMQYKAQVIMQNARKDDAAVPQTQNSSTKPAGEPVVEMKNVSVTYGPRRVLKNITWTIRKGERYHLQGVNGSGKTTLLSVLTGDHPQSYTQRPSSPAPDSERHLLLFNTPRPRLATPSIHARIGLFTPELFDAFPRRSPGMSVWEAIGTGFHGGFVSMGADGVGTHDASGRELSEEQKRRRVERCWEVLKALGPGEGRWGSSASTAASASTPTASSRIPPPSGTEPDPALLAFASAKFPSLPVGAQRMVLLMRALVGRPPLVLLDEVWSGMDEGMVRTAHAYLRRGGEEGGVAAEQAVVVVSHLEEEVPWGARDGVQRVMLRDGELSSLE